MKEPKNFRDVYSCDNCEYVEYHPVSKEQGRVD